MDDQPPHAGILTWDESTACKKDLRQVYLACPLTNLTRAQKANATRIRDVVHRELLRTKACDFEVYDPSGHTPPGSEHSCEEVCSIDRRRVVSSDLFIHLCLWPSDGAGMEHVWANSASVPKLVIYRDGSKVSRLTLAQAPPCLEPICFTGIRNLVSQLRSRMRELVCGIVLHGQSRRKLMQSGSQLAFRRLLIRSRLLAGLSQAEFAIRCNMHRKMVEIIELDDFVVLSMSQAEQLSMLNALGARLQMSAARGLTIPQHDNPVYDGSVPQQLHGAWSESLNALVDLVINDAPEEDEIVCGLWADYHEMVTQAVVGRNDFSTPVTLDRWRAAYSKNVG